MLTAVAVTTHRSLPYLYIMNLKHILYILPFFVFAATSVSAQKHVFKDTVKLDSVLIRDSRIKYLPDVNGINIFAGKKTFSISPNNGKANLPNGNARMIFAQVPGVNVWDMDGAGLQLNIGTRGTDSHRSIETNFRQNGYNTNSDVFGYPENHYTQPIQAVQEIQIVRGSAALQFGSQYGGMVNLKIKQPDSIKVFGLESYQTVGSNNFFNSYNAISGTSGKISYYAYYSNRSGDGWRPDAAFSYHAYYAHLQYQFNSKGSIALEFSRMNYRQQIAGGLTDAQFKANNRQATRFRNFFQPEINLPAILFNYKFSANTKLNIISHAIIGQRNSVQFIANPNVPDTVNAVTKNYNPRQVDRDYYKGFTTEARLLHSYQLGNLTSTLSAGVRYFTETTNRWQKGIGTIGTNFDLSLVQPYGIDVNLHTSNYAVFAENIFKITPKFSVTPGFRYENIQTSLVGVVNNRTLAVNYNNTRSFPLFGTGLQYQLTATSQLYGNISQAYRPYIYANVTPADQFSIIDPNLKDSKGYDIDFGYRGHAGYIFNYDVNVFNVYYGNRVGNLTLLNPSNVSYLYITNIGNAVVRGVEAFTEVSLLRSFNHSSSSDLRLYNSLAYNHARYTSGIFSQNNKVMPLTGNYVESTPDWIDRAGLSYLNKHITATLQYSYVGKSFSDANNTVFNAIGSSSVVPSYHIFDLAFSYSFLKHYHFNANLNNALNAKYFTRRINMYPGPGILPADGRAFNLGFGIIL